ncbi:non-heme iron oxygenase ferredoxin subunit [Pseudogulbenkiania sp. MAI-1]|uniref:non-heme iron oxygenase ferredoxin subunit n=1 Tax=Pseudogulbenkiania sp. MAI-1 TaxID=990370 RepID=UPI00045E9657|nr:non-heme iron oxygenase ferredoxin subunit [Pseudogulbenkiania sp. MAI-1]
MSDWVDVAPADEFEPGSFRTLDVDGVPVAVFNVNGRYYAIEDLCTHEAETLSEGDILDENIICPRHGSMFSLVTGEALTPPAYEPVATFPVRVENGMVQVKDDRFD